MYLGDCSILVSIGNSIAVLLFEIGETPVHFDGKDRQPAGDHFALHHDLFRNFQTHVGEVPDRPDSPCDHGVGHLLREGGRNADDPDTDLKPADEFLEPFDAEDAPPVDFGTDLAGIGIEGGDDLESVLFEPFVAEQGAAERTGADQNRLGRIVPVEIAFDRLDQLFDLVADAGLAGDAGDGEVLADDDSGVATIEIPAFRISESLYR